MAQAIRFKEDAAKSVAASREIEESRDRYIFYPGPAANGTLLIPAYEHNVGIESIERGSVVEVTNHRQIMRDSDDRGTPGAEAFSTDRALVRVWIRAGLIANWFERRYGQRGGVSLDALVGLPRQSVALIITRLLPQETSVLKTLSLLKLRTMVTAGLESINDDMSFPSALKAKADQTATRMIQGIDQAEIYCLNYLQDLKGEMQQRRTGGRGTVSLTSPVEKQLLPLVEKKASEYQIDSQELERLRIAEIGDMMQSRNTTSDIPSIIAAVMQAMNITPNLGGRGVPIPEPIHPLVVDPVELPEEEPYSDDEDDEDEDSPDDKTIFLQNKPRIGRPPRLSK